ncbi:MAG: GDP-mannose 4,6-dehydratase [Ignavibacteria bacterium]|nr:GDP-mannose 4,6-dehydratase [Ignavibacteria bacterium]
MTERKNSPDCRKYLVTGFSGFVSRNYIEYLGLRNSEAEIMGIDLREPDIRFDQYRKLIIKFQRIDLRDREKLCKVVYDFKPDYILHLASFSSVAGSWNNPCNSFQNNVNIFLNLLEVVRAIGSNCRIICVGSSEEYGNVKISDLPLSEDKIPNPTSPFGIARLSQEMLAKLYVEVYDLDIILTRSFNHIGAGQDEKFAVSSFAKQLVELLQERKNEFLVAGDVTIIRDFIDVRDVVKAYYQLFREGKKGEVYNICSGYGISLQNIIEIMSNKLKLDITIKEDRSLRRPKDNPVIIGSNRKIKSDIQWNNEIPLEESLNDVLNYYLIKNEYSAKGKSTHI